MEMNQLNNQMYPVIYKTLVGIVLVIAIGALAAETLPEVHAKPLVVTALLCIIGLSSWDLIKSRKRERNLK